MLTDTPPLDSRVVELLRIAATTFDALDIQYALVGGMAMLTYGVLRNTADVDAFLPEKAKEKVFKALRKQGLDILSGASDHEFYAVKPGHNQGNSVEIRIDLMFPNDSLELFGMKYPRRGSMWGVEYNVLTAPILAAIKFRANDESIPELRKHGIDVDMLYRKGIISAVAVHTLLEDDIEKALFAQRIGRLNANTPKKNPWRKT